MCLSSLKSRPIGSRWLACLISLPCLVVCVRAETVVGETSHSPIAEGPLHAYVATVALPADGLWRIRAPQSQDSARELYLMPTEPSRLRQLGKRMYAALEERQIQYGRWQVQMGFEACRQFAQERQGVGPKAISDLAQEKRWGYVAERWDSASWQLNRWRDFVDTRPIEGPFIHLIPDVRFRFAPPNRTTRRDDGTAVQGGATPDTKARWTVPKKDREVLAFELRPFIDDGKHWVLYTDGDCQRVDIDSQLSQSQRVTIRPIVTQPNAQPTGDDEPNLEYRLVMVREQPFSGSLELQAENHVLDQERTIRWNAADGSDVPYRTLRDTITDARRFAWGPYSLAADGGVLKVWDLAGKAPPPDPNPRRSLSMFSVLGGRAAVEETLQLQDLRAIDSELQSATIDIDSLSGVEVKSHPFEEMLGGREGGRLEIAGCVPPDRFFVYVGKPESIPALLDTGAPFIASMGTALTGNCLQYNLQSRYLARLGMTRDWVDAVLTSGLTSELALFTPDLFFIDGTDVTIVARLRQPQLLRQLLGMLGASDLGTESVLELPTVSGGPAYLALRDDLLFASTHRGELQQAIDLHDGQGSGSLGESAEFRYMLTQLPVNEDTRVYAYLSDGFVRKLVGPRTKIGQRRRVLAKAKMEVMTAQAMLARLDGYPGSDSASDLIRSGHLPQGWQSEGMSIDASGLVRSHHYDTLPRMRTLPEVPLDRVTPAEAEAYRRYVENYSRYWRRFFDPIAIRLDDVGSDQLELSTFILPLVDNSIYNTLKTFLAHQDDQTTLSVPIVEPTPVVQFSANLKDMAWQVVAGNFSEFFTRYSGASPAMLDDLGPSVHVAVFDADPIIAIGSGDVFGAFGGNVLRGGGNEMLMIPVALSMLTRPCSIMVETESPERTSQYLRQAALAGMPRQRRDRDFNVSFYQVGDRDEWVWTMDVFGVVKLRYGVEVVDKYLVIRNIPWSSGDRVVSVAPADLNAAMLQASPSACKEQLPGLFAAASDANRRAVMSGLGRLYPFMLSGSKSVDQAAAEHQRLYGFYPRQLDGDRWRWTDYRMVSDHYGEPTRQRQPAFAPDKPFGLMNRIDSIQLNMQFESDGLRSSVRWRLR
ncbi:hypothetical protein Mal15_44300 [Stieleria maiorica]|uniref:Uncharacterized protein n=1 Tax=Stieleria maiorica TaxID=2795974 RepID=A0A5B9MIT1_9BACT|nr:hypothetical protein [Stieleria maiorica]QEG00360.1 hypothetical protein Mal15_44300 [Stieleria maiorica]